MRGRTSGARTGAAGRGTRKGMDALDSLNGLLVHDIRHLSFRLGALLQNLEHNYEDPLFKRSVVEILTDSVRRMETIVRRCRDRRGEVIVKIPIDANEILHGVVESLPRSWRGRRDVLIEERYARVPRLWGDPEFLREAFGILIQNGLEALGKEGGRLTVSTRPVKTVAGKRRIDIRVSDTGCGMSPGFIRDHLFVPFVTTKDDGFGMGLHICRQIVTLHHGSIRVSSREGRGTTFRVVFDGI